LGLDHGGLAAVTYDFGTDVTFVLDGTGTSTTDTRTWLSDQYAARTSIATTRRVGTRVAREEQQSSHHTCHTHGRLTQPTQEPAPRLTGAGGHRLGIPSDLLKHDQPPLSRKKGNSPASASEDPDPE
jgi:hypothetical protein